MAGAPVDLLRRVPLFAELEKRDLEQVARQFKERSFPAGEVIVKEGSGGGAFYIIESGEVTVSIGGEERSTLKAGDYFGEIALIDEGTRMATIAARTDLDVYGLTLWEFRPIVQQNGTIGWALLKSMAKLIREAQAG